MKMEKVIIFGGDLCLGGREYQFSDKIVEFFTQADYSILNLEGPIIENKNQLKEYPKAGPHLFQRKNVISELRKLKVSYLGGANNHLIDYGIKGVALTKKILDVSGIKYGGFGLNLEEAKKELIFDQTNIAVICAGEEEFGMAGSGKAGCYSMYDDGIIAQTEDLKKKNKFIIIYAHGGGEEVPLPSKYIIKRDKEFIDSGADLVVGHHPHVPQGWEKYKKRYLFYSLGNFVHQAFTSDWGILLQITIKDNELRKYKIIPISVKDNFVDIIPKNDRNCFHQYLKTVNEILVNEEEFQSIYQEQAIKMYESYYQDYFTGLFVPKLRGKEKKDQLLLLHLLRNNSAKEFIEVALKIKTKEVKDLRNKKSSKIFKRLANFINQENSE